MPRRPRLSPRRRGQPNRTRAILGALAVGAGEPPEPLKELLKRRAELADRLFQAGYQVVERLSAALRQPAGAAANPPGAPVAVSLRR